MTGNAPTCPYCLEPATLRDSAEVYGGRSYGPMYICVNYPRCDSYVGVHKGTDEPLGRMANGELRSAKQKAHAAFDPLWQTAHLTYQIKESNPGQIKKAQGRIRRRARFRCYRWLAHELNIDLDDCHIGMFDTDMCRRTVELCKEVNYEFIREWDKNEI